MKHTQFMRIENTGASLRLQESLGCDVVIFCNDGYIAIKTRRGNYSTAAISVFTPEHARDSEYYERVRNLRQNAELSFRSQHRISNSVAEIIEEYGIE